MAEKNISINPTLKSLLDKLVNDIDAGMSTGMLRVLSVAEAHAVDLVPVQTSDLLNSITSFVIEGGRVGILKATALHAKFVHDGTGLFGPKKRRYTIRPKSKKALFWPGARHPVKEVIHPGIRPQPFLADAVEKTDLGKEFVTGISVFLDRRGW